jgi:hypothetical protein
MAEPFLLPLPIEPYELSETRYDSTGLGFVNMPAALVIMKLLESMSTRTLAVCRKAFLNYEGRK